MFWERIVVNNYERLLLSRNGHFDRILVPGEYHVLVANNVSVDVEKHNVLNPVFHSRWRDYFIDCRPELVKRHFTLIKTTDTQVAMVYLNGELFRVLVPAKRLLFWREAAAVTAEYSEVVAESDPPSELFEAAFNKQTACC